jgi:hydroxymethylpyrimidine/phosphomethylpyrimidine kinase
MQRRKDLPIALTVAGSDSGGGAGIQADLKTFAFLGVHGTSVLTCVTAQNPARVAGIEACSPEIVRSQLEAVFSELRPGAMKTGMLYSAKVVGAVVEFLSGQPRPPLVVDPVLVSTSGTVLLKPTGVVSLFEQLLPLAALVTPNVQEASVLLRREIESVEDMRAAAKELRQRFGCAALVKGGHLGGLRDAVDIFNDGKEELLLRAPFVRGICTHGTGCVYSAAITAYLARGLALPRAVSIAKEYITRSISRSRKIGDHWVLGFGV